MRTRTLRIPTTDGQADAFAAFPDHSERHPGVLMYADGFDIRPVLREIARRLAGPGYYVLVPNSFHRHGPAPLIELPEYIGEEVRPAVFARLMPLIEAHTAERVLSDADAYLRFLTTRPEVSAGPVAVTGYCMDGLYAMRTAAAHRDHVAAAAACPAPLPSPGPQVAWSRVGAGEPPGTGLHGVHASGARAVHLLALLADVQRLLRQPLPFRGIGGVLGGLLQLLGLVAHLLSSLGRRVLDTHFDLLGRAVGVPLPQHAKGIHRGAVRHAAPATSMRAFP
ncbi:dienelactone hydrolase family protein [Streptomyces erythrochromogenes]